MKVIKEKRDFGIFPMKIVCEQKVDVYGLSYGKENDFCGSELEIEADDIKAHEWHKYPDYQGTDYGVVCPICGQFVVIDEKNIPTSAIKNAKKISLHNR
jgi:hypothetical protein